MISPRRTSLVRVPDLRVFRAMLASLAVAGDVAATRGRAIIVPTSAAAEQLRRTIEGRRLLAAGGALVLPDVVTRDEWYRAMHLRIGADPPLLSGLERSVIAGAAARDALDAGFAPPFRPRAALVDAVLGFYDAFRRQRRTIDDFERLVLSDLAPRVDLDHGAERMLRQTRFVVALVRAYEARCAASGAIDEHTLRVRLLDSDGAGLYRHVIVAVGDRQSDPPGLWDADFDLLTRLPGLTTIDLVATEAALAAGFVERVSAHLPGVEEITVAPAEEMPPPPSLVVPASDPPARCFTFRDRETELVETARAIKMGAAAGSPRSLDRTAVVFRRPLPYVYLARTIFDSACIPYEAADALPLAAEPYAAALDLVFTAITTSFARQALIDLLRSPHVDLIGHGQSGDGSQALSEVGVFDRALEKAGFLGGRDALSRLAETWSPPLRALASTVISLVEELIPLSVPAPASVQISRLDAFLRAHERLPGPADTWRDRHLRARGAILGALAELGAAHRVRDDPTVGIADLAVTVRRWIETETFAPRTGAGGVQLLDAHTAPFADLDEAYVVGLVGSEWPGGAGREIFYPPFLLAQLGWPPESSRLGAARASFADLVRSPLHRVAVSTFALEDDAIVEPSPLLEELDRGGLDTIVRPPANMPRILPEEALALEPVRLDVVAGPAAEWAALRAGREMGDRRRFRGWAGGAGRQVYKITALDRYLDCPFRYFASEVLEIVEPDEAGEGLSRRDEGRLVHDVLRAFFDEWQRGGRGAIVPETLDEARRVFALIAERELSKLAAPDARQVRATLLGTAVSAGIGEVVLGADAESADEVLERLLEHDLDGDYEISDGARTRRVQLRARADRIDLLAGNRFRIIDYKLGRADSAARSIQLPAYAVCAASQLARRRGGLWEVAGASYLAFGRRDAVRSIVPARQRDRDPLTEGQGRLLDAIDGIERGEFPPRPADTMLCQRCGYGRVCRKEYVVDVDTGASL